MAMTPAQEARYALGYGLSRSDLSMAAQIEYDRLVAGQEPSQEGERPQTREERKQARQERLEEYRRKRQEGQERAAATTWFPHLGVAVREGQVYQHGAKQSGMASDLQAKNERTLARDLKPLGSLAGAHAEVGGGKGGRRRSPNARVADAALATAVLGTAGLLAGLSRTGFRGFVVVSFADGGAWEKSFTDSASLIKAQAEAVRFNALAASAGSPAAQDGGGVAAELERLSALHKSGALDDEEFRAAKARIIGGITS
jgi:Short C-terminal domain